MTLYAVAFFSEEGGYELIPELIFEHPKEAESSAERRAYLTGMNESEHRYYWVIPVENR